MIVWREQMSVDDGGVIDQDHKHLIDIINRFENFSADGLERSEAVEIVYALKFYAGTHFGREEQLQLLVNFPFAKAHKQEHKELIAHLDSVINDFNNPNVDIDRESKTKIASILRNWLLDHILSSDQKMREFVLSLNEAGSSLGALKDIEIDT